MAKRDDDGLAPRDALGVPVTVGARVVYATGRGGGLLKEGVITRVQHGQTTRCISSARARRQTPKHHLGRILPA